MKENNIDKLVEATMHSLDAATRATTKPYFATRLGARMQQPGLQNIWMKLGALLSRPSVALPGILLLLAINAMIILNNSTLTHRKNSTENAGGYLKDEFAINIVSIYETENQ